MSTALVRQELSMSTWQMIESVAPVMKNSRLFGVASEHQAMAIMAKGYELGLSITSAFEFIAVIQDKPVLIPRGALALIQQSGELESIEIKDEVDDEGNPTGCSVTMKRKNGMRYSTQFTMKHAETAGLVKEGSAWKKYPANMLRWRAIGFCADVVFPDVIGGMKRADEFGAAVDEAGDVIQGEWSTVEDKQPEPESSTGDELTLQDLLDEWGPEAVMEAFGGIPNTPDEVEQVYQALKGKDDE